jgi:DNA-binding NarL/FixJ family response regulator
MTLSILPDCRFAPGLPRYTRSMSFDMKPQTRANPARGPAQPGKAGPYNNAADGRLRPRDNQRIRLLVAGVHPIVRRGIIACLEEHTHLRVVAEAANGAEALSKARELRPDVLLTDIDMPHLTGLAVSEALYKEQSRIRVLLMATSPRTDIIECCARSGASGCILKQAPLEEFAQAIETVSADEPFFSPALVRVAFKHLVPANGREPGPSVLTNREREVLTYIAEGLSNKEIASRLNVGSRTVETHRKLLERKLKIRGVAGLTRFALTKGLVSIPESDKAGFSD